MSSLTTHPAIDAAVLLRVRNRLIEYLEVAASFDEQREYQRRAPGVNVAGEVLHQWEDWLTEDWPQRYAGPIFSEAERAAMTAYHAVVDPLAKGAVAPSLSLEQVQELPQWQGLRAAAENTLAVFMQRGKLPEPAQAS